MMQAGAVGQPMAPPEPCSEGLLQRSSGQAFVGARLVEGVSRLHRLRQQGIAKVRFPRPVRPRAPKAFAALEAVVLNTAGGLTGGDDFRLRLEAAEGAHLIAASQACEKIYRSIGGTAHVATEISVSDGARVDWLPQETILFDRADLTRSLTVDLAPDAGFFGLEALICGRTAMREQVTYGRFRDRLELRRGGRPVFVDIGRLDGAISAALARPAVANGARAFASALYVGRQEAAVLAAWRGLSGPGTVPGTVAGVGARDGVVHLRVAARDGLALRRFLMRAIEIGTGGQPPPVWSI